MPILALLADGMPHWLLPAYLLAEIVFGSIGVYLLKVGEE